jgi:hypothetical protein
MLKYNTVNVSCLYREVFVATGSRNSLKDIRNPQMMPDQVRKWLGQQSKYFYAAGLDALVKRCDKCIDVGAEYVEK